MQLLWASLLDGLVEARPIEASLRSGQRRDRGWRDISETGGNHGRGNGHLLRLLRRREGGRGGVRAHDQLMTILSERRQDMFLLMVQQQPQF